MKRIEWVDIFKAIAISCVVYGHIGFAYPYVYQFHMAAFFFIAGYTLNFRKPALVFVLQRFYSLIVPFAMLLFGFALIDPTLSGQRVEAIKWFILHGSSRVSVLGAAWFLVALFFAELVQYVVWRCSRIEDKNRMSWCLYSMSTLTLLGVGLKWYDCRNFPSYELDLALIAQAFVGLGVVIRTLRVFESKIMARMSVQLTLLFVTGGIMVALSSRPPVFSFPMRQLSRGIGWALFASANGILCCTALAMLFNRVRWQWIRASLLTVGRNTLGILFLHFLMFKVVYLFLAVYGIVGWESVWNLVPTEYNIIIRYHWMFFIVSMLLSIVTWQCIGRFRLGRLLTGRSTSIKSMISKFSIPKLPAICIPIKTIKILSGVVLSILLSLVGWWIVSPDNHFVFDDMASWYLSTFRDGPFASFSWLPAVAHDDRPIRDIFMFFVFRCLGAGNREFVSHTILLLIHVSNMALIFLSIRKFLGEKQQNGRLTAFGAAVIWGCWPTSTLASFWLSGIHDSLGLTLLLFAFLCYWVASPHAWIQWLRWLGFLVLYFVLLRTKEMFVVVPALMILAEFANMALCHEQGMPWNVALKRRLHVGRVIVIGIALVMMMGYMGVLLHHGTSGFYETSFSPLVMMSNLVKYVGMYVDLGTFTMMSQKTPSFFVAMIVVVAGVSFLLREVIASRRFSLLIVLMMFVCMISTVLTLVHMTHILYLYVPTVYVAILMSVGIVSRWKYSKTLLYVVIPLSMIFVWLSPAGKSMRTYWRNVGSSDRIALDRLRAFSGVRPGMRFYVVDAPAGYNLFTYAGATAQESAVIGAVFSDKTLTREYSSEVNTNQPYVVVSQYPNLKFGYELPRKPAILRLIPSMARISTPFNVQPNGRSAIAIEGEAFPPSVQVRIGGVMAEGVCRASDSLITCLFPEEMLSKTGRIEIRCIGRGCDSAVAYFEIQE